MPYDFTKDPLVGQDLGVTGPARRLAVVTPNDASDLSRYARCLYIGGTGDIAVIPVGNGDTEPVTMKAHPPGWCLVAVRRVLSTGTTATGILAAT